MQFAILIVTLAAYFIAVLAFYLRLMRPGSRGFTGTQGARLSLVVAAMLQLTDIGFRSAITQTCPVTSARFGLSLAALIAVIIFLVWARSERSLSLGIIVTPIAFAMFVASEALDGTATQPDVPSWFLALHVTVNLLSVGLFVVAAAAAVAYLVQSTRLKSKRATVKNVTFPGLSSLESLSHRLLGVGLGFMTLGVVSGAVFADHLSHGGIESLRVSLSYACWLVAAVVVVGQRATGWHGRRVAWGTILSAAFAVALVLIYALTTGGAS